MHDDELDPLAKMTSDFDQISTMLNRQVAPLLAGYYKTLVLQGFSGDQAFNLVREYQQILLRQQR